MACTQLDMVRRQSEAAVRNERNRAAALVRRETSLVAQAGRLAGGAVRNGGDSLGRRLSGGASARRDRAADVVATEPPPVRPAADGYVRRTPVQPVYEAADYRRRLALRGVGILALLLAAAAGLYFLGRLGLLGR